MLETQFLVSLPAAKDMEIEAPPRPALPKITRDVYQHRTAVPQFAAPAKLPWAKNADQPLRSSFFMWLDDFKLEDIVVDAPSTGFASSIGQATASRRLFTTVDITEDDERSALHIFNPAADTFVPVTARISLDGASRDVELEVGPQRTTRVPLTELATGRYTLELIATRPIVATREITGLSSRSWAPLLPIAEPVSDN